MRRAKQEVESYEPEIDYDHANLLPPWRELLPDGRLSPWYGPMTQGGYTAAIKDYQETREAGSLFDNDTDAETRVAADPDYADKQAARYRRSEPRYDHAKMSNYVERCSHEIPMRELEVYFNYYRDLRSKGETARLMGVSANTFKALLGSLRHRMRDARSSKKAPLGSNPP